MSYPQGSLQVGAGSRAAACAKVPAAQRGLAARGVKTQRYEEQHQQQAQRGLAARGVKTDVSRRSTNSAWPKLPRDSLNRAKFEEWLQKERDDWDDEIVSARLSVTAKQPSPCDPVRRVRLQFSDWTTGW